MFFSRNTTSGVITAIKNIFQLNIVSRHEKYLGLPSMVGRKRSEFFNDIKLRVYSKNYELAAQVLFVRRERGIDKGSSSGDFQPLL